MSFEITTYYKRGHVIKAATKEELFRRLHAKNLTSKAHHYTEVWEVSDKPDKEGDGELFGIYEDSNIRLTESEKPLHQPRAYLTK